jgi:hypothetical protein
MRVSDVNVGARWRFANVERHALELAVAADVVFPLGSRSTPTQIGLSQEFWSARAAVIATKDLGRLTMNAEFALGVPIAGDSAGVQSVAQMNLALGYQLRPWLQPEIELNYQHQLHVTDDPQVLAVTTGLVASVSEQYRVVVAFQQGIWKSDMGRTTAIILALTADL